MPYILGNECAGEVVAVGDNVDEKTFGYKVGDKVAVGPPFLLRLVQIPPSVTDQYYGDSPTLPEAPLPSMHSQTRTRPSSCSRTSRPATPRPSSCKA